MSRVLVLAALALLWLCACRRDPLHTPSCRDAEKDVCRAEAVDLTPADLLRPGEEASWMVEEEVQVSCTLRESGRLEKCHVGRASEALGERISEVLGKRRYVPVEYRGKPIAVSYDLLVRLLPVGKRAMDARTAAFWWAIDQVARCPDGGVGTVCVASAAMGVDPSPSELATVGLHGVRAVPASSCEGQEGMTVVHLVGFELWGDRGQGDARVYGLCVGEHVHFAVERADGGWSFTATQRNALIAD